VGDEPELVKPATDRPERPMVMSWLRQGTSRSIKARSGIAVTEPEDLLDYLLVDLGGLVVRHARPVGQSLEPASSEHASFGPHICSRNCFENR